MTAGTPREALRCDGCGEETIEAEASDYFNSSYRATYCPRCEALRKHFSLAPRDHEQYRLLDVADEIAERWSA